MSTREFLDTNVLVYADDRDAGAKRTRALEILERCISTRLGALSTQVLQEYFVVSTRKLGVEVAAARRKVELLATLDVVEIDVPMILAAIDLQRLYSFSFWDSLILRAARVAGCPRLLSEDLNHGQVIDGVEIVNPFLGLDMG